MLGGLGGCNNPPPPPRPEREGVEKYHLRERGLSLIQNYIRNYNFIIIIIMHNSNNSNCSNLSWS